MSSFVTPLIVSPMPDGKNWMLVEAFEYRIGSEKSDKLIFIPAGFITDFASVPRLFFFLPDWATYSKSPVLHDWLYRVKMINGKKISRKKADQVFLEAMKVDWRHHRSRWGIATLEYIAVRLFAFLAWRIK